MDATQKGRRSWFLMYDVDLRRHPHSRTLRTEAIDPEADVLDAPRPCLS